MASRKTTRRSQKRPAAKKAAPARTVAGKATRKAPTRRPAAADEPVQPLTLEQARATIAPVAKATASGARRRGTMRRAVEETTVGEVAAERKKLELRQRDERRQRIAEYRQVMGLLQQTGVRVPARRAATGARRAAAKGARRAKAARVVAAPLRILAEGDSWFDYPVPFFGGSIIPRLEKRLGIPILNLAKAGDEVRFMMGVEQRLNLRKQLKQGSPAGGPWDVLLFSGGGNDIVSDPLAIWLRDFAPGQPPELLLDQVRFGAALALIRAGYEDLIRLRDTLSPATHLVMHSYDFAIPDGRGICHLGPWLKPAFDLRGFPDLVSRTAVVKLMLTLFDAEMRRLASPNVTVVPTQGRLKPVPASWHNELHPTKAGFDSMAEAFAGVLKKLFPGRL
jgi:hypothetical protein